MSTLTPMMQQYMEIKEQNRDALLFFRLGDFYEMFFEDAELASRELEITLTARDCGLSEKAPMCGVPYHSAEGYIARLIEKGYKVAICEQTQDPAEAKGLVKREVVRVITPGTLLESSMLDEKDNNFIMAIYMDGDGSGLSWADISTGEFNTCKISEEAGINTVLDIISGIGPKEIVIGENEDSIDENVRYNLIMQGFHMTPYNNDAFEYRKGYQRLINHFNIHSLEGFGCENMGQGVNAAGALIAYLGETQKNSLRHITALKPIILKNSMVLDRTTRRNLELTETIRGKTKKGSLLWLLDRTNTAMGGRLLRQWIQSPLTKPEPIKERLDGVEELFNNPIAMEEMRRSLKDIYDLERLAGRISYGNANARDLISLKQSLSVLPEIKKSLKTFNTPICKGFYRNLDTLDDVYNLIHESINEEPPVTIKEGSIIKDGYREELDRYRRAMTDGRVWLAELESQEREKTGIKNLRVGFNKVFGYYLEVTKSYYELVPEEYIRKQTLANSERYITPELKEVEDAILGAEEKSIDLEYRIFLKIRDRISMEVDRIQDTAKIISRLDALWSLARVAQENDYSKPTVNNGNIIDIRDGRHPVVEKTLKDSLFVPNDIYLDDSDNQISIITGPNMAGKSTYMRQAAIIVLMAQIGSFVSAREATIGVVDRIFTRVGASDDLTGGQSTFMVEMSEMSNILNNATPKSLLILDEIGRGTSTYDGLSIAWSIVEYIQKHSGSRTLFATHYHELTELEGRLEGVKNFNITVRELGKDIIFLRKVVRGGAEKSLGVQVARLAGLPRPVIQRANGLLKELEKSEINKGKPHDHIEKPNPQLSFFDSGLWEIQERLKAIDIQNTTPMEAMVILNDLIEKSKETDEG